mmetsp:Transcript_33052/g.64441  ORF Transcript_33052/g.64441 Transcript_33052/m.64441 type:complete len:94 (-) Transcript_33052:136-417(-)
MGNTCKNTGKAKKKKHFRRRRFVIISDRERQRDRDGIHGTSVVRNEEISPTKRPYYATMPLPKTTTARAHAAQLLELGWSSDDSCNGAAVVWT